MQMADLLSAKDSEDSEEGLNEQEVEVLQKAGIIRGRLSASPRKRAKNHIVFVEEQAEGSSVTHTSDHVCPHSQLQRASMLR